MNALDFWDVSDWREIKRSIQIRNPFLMDRFCNKEMVQFTLEGVLVDETCRYAWKGAYVIRVFIRGNAQGCGYSTHEMNVFETFEKFIRFADKGLKDLAGYTPLLKSIVPIEQLAF